MKQKLIEVLRTQGVPVYLQGSLNPDSAYPETFFTFWNFETPRGMFYNNSPKTKVWGFWVNAYSDDPETLEKTINSAAAQLRKCGYVVDGDPIDTESGKESHTGASITVYMIEEETENEQSF